MKEKINKIITFPIGYRLWGITYRNELTRVEIKSYLISIQGNKNGQTITMYYKDIKDRMFFCSDLFEKKKNAMESIAKNKKEVI